jgi:hypothetical protein
MARKPRTIHELCIARLGVHRGAIAAARVAQWAMVAHDLGRLPTTVEYAEWWSLDERTGWRHRAAIRDALGEEWEPTIEALAAQITDRMRSPRAVLSLAVA